MAAHASRSRGMPRALTDRRHALIKKHSAWSLLQVKLIKCCATGAIACVCRAVRRSCLRSAQLCHCNTDSVCCAAHCCTCLRSAQLCHCLLTAYSVRLIVAHAHAQRGYAIVCGLRILYGAVLHMYALSAVMPLPCGQRMLCGSVPHMPALIAAMPSTPWNRPPSAIWARCLARHCPAR